MSAILLAGTSNRQLSESVGKILGIPLGAIEITRFIDNECRVYIKENVEDKDVFVIQSLSTVADQHLVELCLIGQALKSLKANKVTAVIPWMGYSKQDKAFRKGEAISSQLVAKFIEAAGFDAVVACELHSEAVIPYFHIPMTELSTHYLLSEVLKKKEKLDEAVVVSPDTGGKSRSELFAASVGLPVVYLDKTRDLETGEVTVTDISGPVDGRHIIIFDDIINTGATAIKTSRFLSAKGAREIYFLATHAVFAGQAVAGLMNSPIAEVIVTDTIAIPDTKLFPKLTVVSVAPLLSDAISAGLR